MCECVCAQTDSLAWWKMLTFNVLFFTLFIKYKATDLAGPLNLTPPSLSQSHSPFLHICLALFLSLAMEKLIAE